jgi:hypothetical protein
MQNDGKRGGKEIHPYRVLFIALSKKLNHYYALRV